MTPQEAAARIDHTLLSPDAGPAGVERLCDEAVEHGFAAVCVNPWLLPLAARLLSGHAPLPITVVGFPLGADLAVSKAEETARLVSLGAAEIDMVLNVGALKAGEYGLVRADIAGVVAAAGNAPVKVIIEACLLTDEEKATACRLVAEGGAAFVKTSTGFSRGGATVEDIRLLRRAAPPHLRIKASGGIRTASQARALFAAGADRLGASASVAILREWDDAPLA
jgi:deoxyribose-phosphate aldolase